ncbi:TrbG/VirB9 family P-type conjugative transfer protein [Erythrobacter sp.]|jgi:type IV secretion system protein VirB9|uniref:TrbG/VirB9 family P-type conjugative transfer protein n=1 Tax=Erythrobacter sp. TaxID=1042 RepID=UPI002E9CB815|nr:TrbG/VirB9 family P-type conjugative transfer protein [Erythrobacter sp.]
MKRAGILAFVLACGFAAHTPVSAQNEVVQPAPTAPADPRLVTQVFDENRVYTINGKVKVQTTVKFAPDEAIQNVAIGDSNAWQVQPNQAQTLLFIKPLEPAARTNMTVVTTRRTYLFDLVASPRNAPLYVMQFRYPELERAEAEAALAAAEDARREEANALELAAARDPYAVVDPARLNFAWEAQGTRELLPARAYDNGTALFLVWPTGTAIPAILVTNEDGEEGPVNFTVRGDTVVLDSVPPQIILRAGGDAASLTNTGPAPAPAQSARAQGADPRGS